MTASSVLPVILAPFVGSFLAVLVRRLPRGESVVRPRSHCEACGRVLGVAELIPVLSFAALRGRCAGCGSPISPDHLLIELAAVLPPLAVMALIPDAPVALALFGSALGWVLLALSAIDWRHWRLPDALTLPLLVLALGWTAWWEPDALADHALAAASGWLGIAVLAAAYRRVRGRPGLGLGDAKLLGAGGAAIGLEGLGPCLLLAALLGIALALARHGRRAGRASAVPFGPALALAIFASWLLEQRGLDPSCLARNLLGQAGAP